MTTASAPLTTARGEAALGRVSWVRNPWVVFLARRLGRLLVSVAFLVTLAFLMIHLIPGDPVRAALGISAPPELVAARQESLGLNDPIVVQYVNYVKALFSGDLGVSMTSGVAVSETIGQRLPASAGLAAGAFTVVMIVSIPLGLCMAVLTRGGRRRGTELGFTSTSAVVAAIPEFLLAVGLVFVFGVTLGWLPVAGRDGLSSYILPVLALSLGPALLMARIVRVEALSVLEQDFVRTARAKRLPHWRVYLRHVFPNALTSTLTIGGLLLSAMIVGTVLVENVFAWPGMGMTIVQSILSKDYPLVQGIVLVYGVAVLLVNLLVDLMLAVVDPRSTIREA
ncbi:ABC transporter permease [Phytoactinopolyspora halotolerans]|uniref:ABC transporter permease n=1 Tax=Phytoactinopolyspora halotolerans TaxID=1981512 RepID=A0A6L9SBW9_9ACTN|nr:ABC transporter permease [Phytoactinopolyspora halotolerans]NEE02756.1 ABC transporter permease [Phytoactinopolyspora halotolerans]